MMLLLKIGLLMVGYFAAVNGHGVATSSQSMTSGEGWHYSYGIAHGPHGFGHAVGESYPHGYGGFGTYAPSYGYHLAPPHNLPPHPVVVKVPYEFITPQPYIPPPVVYERPRPIPVVQPHPVYVYSPPQYHHNEHEIVYEEPYYYHH